MSKYIVKGAGDEDVNVFGTIFKPGDTVELQDEAAAPLVEKGVVEKAPEDGAAPAPAEPAADANPEAAPEGGTGPLADGQTPVDPAAPEGGQG